MKSKYFLMLAVLMIGCGKEEEEIIVIETSGVVKDVGYRPGTIRYSRDNTIIIFEDETHLPVRGLHKVRVGSEIIVITDQKRNVILIKETDDGT